MKYVHISWEIFADAPVMFRITSYNVCYTKLLRGVCTVLLDGKPIASCSYLSLRAEDRNVTTVEGIAKEADLIAVV